ncbi:MAG: ABC transporter ATP-binding protein [Hyphomicrobiaceae bacterium]|nr:ABC transporter ATP-binding protein [Hyphomicrobiaceae bacterium]
MTTIEREPAALAVAGLEIAYGDTPAVRGVSLSVGKGEAVAVIGSNGAGKTSMLRGITGLVAARHERLELFGQSLAGLATYRLHRLGIGYVPEGRELFRGLSVEEELQIGGRFLDRGAYTARLDEAFELFPRLKERRTQITRTMSGGEQQMLAIARTLMAGPRLLLLDEPSLGLAPVIQDAVYGTLEALRNRGLSMLIVEQNAFRALRLASRAYVLELGQVTREAPSAELIDDPAIQAAYLGRH